jgi:hypothetical protein
MDAVAAALIHASFHVERIDAFGHHGSAAAD